MSRPPVGTLIPVGAVGDAEEQHVLEGKTFSSELAGVGVTGTMPNVGQQIITPSTTHQDISAGYHDGTGYVVGDANLVPENIRGGVTIFDVEGNIYPPSLLPGVAGNYITDMSRSSTSGFSLDTSNEGYIEFYVTTYLARYFSSTYKINVTNFNRLCICWELIKIAGGGSYTRETYFGLSTSNTSRPLSAYRAEHVYTTASWGFSTRADIVDISGASGEYYIVLEVNLSLYEDKAYLRVYYAGLS